MVFIYIRAMCVSLSVDIVSVIMLCLFIYIYIAHTCSVSHFLFFDIVSVNGKIVQRDSTRFVAIYIHVRGYARARGNTFSIEAVL